MQIEEIRVRVKDLVKGYSEDENTSRVTAWDGKLDVRPEYQREYVYTEGPRDAVINTVLNGFPLNIMYFVRRPDGTYEVLDGQQRIISICRYAQNKFSVKIPSRTLPGKFNDVNFPNLFDDQIETFEDYELQVFICEGTEEEKIAWFQVINIAGEKLENQEILNAVLHSAWLTDAKFMFSRKNCVANRNYGKFLKGDCIRQKYLETAFRWAADAEDLRSVEAYMQKHRNDAKADDLWKYFEDVFAWQQVFGKYDKSMKGVEWGLLYNRHKDDRLAPDIIQEQVSKLLADSEVQRKSGVYEYILTGEKKYLNLRAFDENDKLTMYNRQHGRCASCHKQFSFDQMHGDHVVPWSMGGRTTLENGQMLCFHCNLAKGNRQ